MERIVVLLLIVVSLSLVLGHSNDRRSVFHVDDKILLEKNCYEKNELPGRFPLWDMAPPIPHHALSLGDIVPGQWPPQWEPTQHLMDLAYSYPFTVLESLDQNYLDFCCQVKLEHSCCPSTVDEGGRSCLDFLQVEVDISIQSFNEGGEPSALTDDQIFLVSAQEVAYGNETGLGRRQQGLYGTRPVTHVHNGGVCASTNVNHHHHHYSLDLDFIISGSPLFAAQALPSLSRFVTNQNLELSFSCTGSVDHVVGIILTDAIQPAFMYAAELSG